MRRTRIKFCGVTSATDAAAAAAAGADAIGLVFYARAARRVSIQTAEQITTALPPFVSSVGLFVDSSAQEIIETTSRLGLRTVQLHGGETPELIAKLDRLTIIKAIRADRATLLDVLAKWRQAYRELPPGRLAGILLETAAPSGEPGGTGVENDWSLLECAQRAGWLSGLPPLVVAGGLTPENVGDVVALLRPWAVDVSSGIEEIKGIKSIMKMRAFAAAVSAAEGNDEHR